LTVIPPQSRFDEQRRKAAERATIEAAGILAGECADHAKRAHALFHAALSGGATEQTIRAAREAVEAAYAAVAEIRSEFDR
jgi:hypothetical protein